MRHLNLIILLLFLLACQDKKKDEIKHLVSEWQGKEITGKQPASHTRRNYNLRLYPPIFRQASRPSFTHKKERR